VIEHRIGALFEQLDALERTYEEWDGVSPPAAILSARLNKIEGRLADCERQLRQLRLRS
jgi:hypothetical protein